MPLAEIKHWKSTDELEFLSYLYAYSENIEDLITKGNFYDHMETCSLIVVDIRQSS